VLCQYCQTLCAFEELLRHEEACGARTQPCPLCHRPITLRDFASHESRCNRRNDERNEVSHDPYVPRQRQQAQRADRERQNSSNNLRNQTERPNSVQNANPAKPHKVKAANRISPETIKPSLDPIPIAVKMAMKLKEQRLPLKNKN
jgi:hypothetical protein